MFALSDLEAPVESTHQKAPVVLSGEEMAHAVAAPEAGLPHTAVLREAVLAALTALVIVAF